MAIGKTNVGGGGGGLNFSIKAYASQDDMPSSAKENAIAVITATPISEWAISATEPTDAIEGMVWLSTGTTSDIAFNALKKNTLIVYPAKAQQYVGGAWENKEAYAYMGGQWWHWSTVGIYYLQAGQLQYAATKRDNGFGNKKDAVQEDDAICFDMYTSNTSTSQATHVGYTFNSPIDLTNVTKIKATAKVQADASASNSYGAARLCVGGSADDCIKGTNIRKDEKQRNGTYELEIDVSDISGERVVAFVGVLCKTISGGLGGKVWFYDVWLE